ncbi:hypothetical protein Mapa_009000 [Marchantia paleacea]|nr:hypothetical protein Mapa_009000 [Marchantia paleacea]
MWLLGLSSAIPRSRPGTSARRSECSSICGYVISTFYQCGKYEVKYQKGWEDPIKSYKEETKRVTWG